MEKENSAVEKVEGVTEKNGGRVNKKPTEQEQADKRVKVAKAKKEKQKAKEKAKLEAKKQKEKAKLERATLQEKQKQERIEKKQSLKAVKAEKLRLKREKQAQRAELNRLKAEQKAQAKADKRQKKQERSNRRSSRGVGGWLAAVISLGMACLVLGTLLTINLMGGNSDIPQTMMDYGYRQSFSQLLDYSGNIDVNLSKAFASNDSREMQRLLIKISEESLLAEESLQRLPIDEQNTYYTAKFINQVGDYAKYLNNKLIDGQGITKEEKANLYRLYEINKDLLNALAEIDQEMASGEKVEKLFKGEKSIGIKKLTELEDMAVGYPELIYDGPFSDGLNTRKAKGISGSEYTENGAEKVFKSTFAKYNLSKVEVVGETAGQIPAYTIVATDEIGEEVYAQVSKVGGKLIMFDYNKPCKTGELSEEECIKIGSSFLKDLGIDKMVPVWCETNDIMTTVNFAYKEDGVIIYPDIIKLNICRGEGVVFGMEATNYYLNHTSRDILAPSLSKAQALAKVNGSVNVTDVRLALIPKGNDKEVLTYEIAGEMEGDRYFVYINAKSGHEEQIFKVINTNEGSLLI